MFDVGCWMFDVDFRLHVSVVQLAARLVALAHESYAINILGRNSLRDGDVFA